ncbi:pyruvate dehydrogenase complex dihydrolipoamide acetyltransferase [Bauldia sp.]|uniref:pyruvate dehydrogenase complex dihydrolipoamide acetyltransferase n=1 Tax=Bauldia sp. TaxID=2575872 RepID=UPI003BAC1663
MSINILMPALSPTMEVGNLAKWLKNEGDPIKAGDVIAEIETDKATMEVEAVDEGTLGKIIVPEGTEDVAVNAPIAVLLEEGEDASALDNLPAPDAAPAPPPAEKAEAKPAEPAAAPQAADTPKAAPAPAAPPAKAATNGSGGRVFASPLARRLAKQGGIDLSQVTGSGPHGRVVKADIEAVQSGKAPLAAPAAAPPAIAPGAHDEQTMKLFEEGSYDIIPHDNVRKIIAKRLVEAKTTIPHFYLTIDTEIDALLKLRAEVNAAAPIGAEDKPAWKVSVNDMVIKALAMSLQRVPDANVTWTEAGMLQHKRSDVGVAVAIPGGLITPVVREADTKRLSEISNEMKDLAGRARVRKLAPHEYQGGSTAVSNLGMFGIKDFAAVINPPHATILAVGAGIPTPVVRDNQVEIRTIMTVTLSTDHRAVDGALGAKLLSAFKTLIEKPAAMLA